MTRRFTSATERRGIRVTGTFISEDCPMCDGSGFTDAGACWQCNGSGLVMSEAPRIRPVPMATCEELVREADSEPQLSAGDTAKAIMVLAVIGAISMGVLLWQLLSH